MLARKLFICSAIDQCKETANCCPHKSPHIKDERCVPRECRYATGTLDCVSYEPGKTKESVDKSVKEQDIKETVKKQAVRRPARKAAKKTG